MLQGVDVGNDLGFDEPTYGIPNHQLLFRPFEHDDPFGQCAFAGVRLVVSWPEAIRGRPTVGVWTPTVRTRVLAELLPIKPAQAAQTATALPVVPVPGAAQERLAAAEERLAAAQERLAAAGERAGRCGFTDPVRWAGRPT